MNGRNENTATISVIIVAYNSASCLRECIQSVLAQEKVAVEVIVVDNASVDDTTKVVRDFGGEVSLIVNPDNRGFGRGCNQGFAASSGQTPHRRPRP